MTLSRPRPRLDSRLPVPEKLPLGETTQPPNRTTHNIHVLRRSAHHQTHYHAPNITSRHTYNTPHPHPVPCHVLSPFQPVSAKSALVPALASLASSSGSDSTSAPQTCSSLHPQGFSGMHPPHPPPLVEAEAWTHQIHQARRTRLLPHHHLCVDVGTWSGQTRKSQAPMYMVRS